MLLFADTHKKHQHQPERSPVDAGVLLWQYRTKIVRQMRRQIFRQMKQKAE